MARHDEYSLDGWVMEIVDRVTGRVSPYPADSDEFRSMQFQIDWQHRFGRYRYFYRLRYRVGANNATATENTMVIPIATTAATFQG